MPKNCKLALSRAQVRAVLEHAQIVLGSGLLDSHEKGRWEAIERECRKSLDREKAHAHAKQSDADEEVRRAIEEIFEPPRAETFRDEPPSRIVHRDDIKR